ncbi:hypothetical protein DL764_000437 [Monosporascus ibericus]|uniref:Pre-mRNA-splicing factor SPF27 n=1 Tax=Monosporascus ibericus TaxID=155417 RepID=A0A4Q4TTK1_9PEZI|nr:hypothetical protein DL764_000437 [Monosporascus ibericus]
MSFRTTVHESLPYIDPEPTPAERSAAEALIAAELSSTPSPSTDQQPAPSASLPPLREPVFSPLITQELERVASQQSLRVIDESRYQAPDPSSIASLSSPDELRETLSRAYAASTYLRGREAHLRLLDAYGRNAWLVGNWSGLEAETAALERELAAARREVDRVNVRRRQAQDEAGGELRGLEEAWRRGVGRVLEAEAAAEALRRQVLERRREGGEGVAA